MDAVTSLAACNDSETRDLERLLEVFGSMCSLEDISSAYCEAQRNIEVASEILCASSGNTYGGGGCSSKDKHEGGNGASSQGLSSEVDRTSETHSRLSSKSVLQNTFNEGSTRASKSKAIPVSMGTVSCVIGKEYTRPRSSMNQSKDVTKPLKLDSKQFPVSQIWNEEVQTEKNDKMCNDVEEFLFRILADGFQFDMTVIQEVLSTCGYDVQKSMEKLFSMPAPTLKRCEDDVGLVAKRSTGKHPDIYPSQSVGDKRSNLIESPKMENNRLDHQREVLESLFHMPERFDEGPKRIIPARKVKPRPSRKLVLAPLGDSSKEDKTVSVEPEEAASNEDQDYENSYEFLRKAVKEYWNTMKEYYKSAFDAFVNDDYELADKLLEQGHFFNRKAQEADEKSAEKLLEKNRGRDDEVSLDLHLYEPKEALNLLRLHLTSFSGIPDFKQLKVIVGTNEADSRKGARKRLIVKQLEKESIKWTEELNGEIMLIPLDVIDPKRLSFSKK